MSAPFVPLAQARAMLACDRTRLYPAPVSFSPVPGFSRSRIDRAGVSLRDLFASDEAITDDHIEAFRVLIRFRETFQTPMGKTAMGLRSMTMSEWPELKAAGGTLPVSQRLKRREQILSKLARLPDTRLSNMGDIGGCRAVLQSRAQVDGVLKRIHRNWDMHGRVRDTRDDAAPSGYRAVHVIVVRDGRRIEVQLRDQQEHEWAVAVERTGLRLGLPLKEGQGHPISRSTSGWRVSECILSVRARLPRTTFSRHSRHPARPSVITSSGRSPVPIVHFLLVYDRQQGKLVFQCPYPDAGVAVQKYEEMEETYRDAPHMEIVLIGADSLETIMMTHGNYFDATPSASPYLEGV